MQPPSPGSEPDLAHHDLLGHDVHFLRRAAARPSAKDMERAMRLYHHAGVVREVLRRLLPPRRPGDRVAIALGARPPAAHVVLTFGGAFVTFLAAGMKVKGMPVLPYAAFAPALEAEEARYAHAALRRRQLVQLPLEDFADALFEGPGHLLREMVETVELAPATYELEVHLAIEDICRLTQRLYKLQDRAFNLVLRDRKSPRHLALWQRVWRQIEDGDAILQHCSHLLGLFDTPAVTERLADMLRTANTLSPEMAFALARHRGAGPVLLGLLRGEGQPVRIRNHLARALAGHAIWHPRCAPAIADSLLRDRLPGFDWKEDYFLHSPELARALPQQAEEIIARVVAGIPAPPDRAVEGGFPVPRDELFALLVARLPVSRMFPPRAAAPRMREGWAQHLAQPPLPEVPEVQQRVRSGPRPGRNDPCPCGSGRKYKRCCEGASPQGPSE